MLEFLFLIEKNKNRILIKDDGRISIGRNSLDSFLRESFQDKDFINFKNDFEEEYLNTNDIEIDAEKLFFLMKNPYLLNKKNVVDGVQLFTTSSTNKFLVETKETKEKETKETKEKEKLEYVIEVLENEILIEEEETKEETKKIILDFSGLEKFKKSVKIIDDVEENGKILEFKNGYKILKKNAWNFDILYNPDSKKNEKTENKKSQENKENKFFEKENAEINMKQLKQEQEIRDKREELENIRDSLDYEIKNANRNNSENSENNSENSENNSENSENNSENSENNDI